MPLDFMSDNMHPACTSVFTGRDIDAWLEILRHQERVREGPRHQHVRLSLPDVTYDLPSSRSTAPELVAVALDAINMYEAEVGSSEAGRYLDAGDPVRAAEIMLATAGKILNNQAGADLPFPVTQPGRHRDAAPTPDPRSTA